MLRKAMIVISAAILCGLVAPRAASAGYRGLEYGGGWGEGFVYDGPRYYSPFRRYPDNYPYEGYPYIGYDGPPFYIVGGFGWDCNVWHRPGHRHVPPRTVQLCD